jgi:uncharacterized protein (DUF1800 family)
MANSVAVNGQNSAVIDTRTDKSDPVPISKQQARMGMALAGAASLIACGGTDDEVDTASNIGTASSGVANKPEISASGVAMYASAITDADAARFLQQAQFSSRRSGIMALRTTTYADWLQNRFNLKQRGTGWEWLVDHGYSDASHPAKFYQQTYPADFMIWSQLLGGEDPVRRRLALALSEFFVVSLGGLNISWRSQAMTHWWDTLVGHALGNFRDLLEAVTLNPAMGAYLNTKGNQKEDGKGRVPDENYAREVMQLFTIGLYQLNADGSVKTDGAGQPLESYGQDDVSQLARVFTGYDFDYASDAKVPNADGQYIYPPDFTRRPMKLIASRHSMLETRFLGTTIPAGTPGDQALRMALDTLFQHPNVGPFFGRQMIQRLVTSNPSAAYVARVTAAFNDNGAGVRGDLRAVWSAVLLDDEARGPAGLVNPLHGKLREPMLRFVQWARSFGVTSAAGSWKITDLSDPATKLGQSPLRAPSVFNYFRPGYVPPSTELASRQAVAPEFQVVNETSVGGYLNFMQTVIQNGVLCRNPLLPDLGGPSIFTYDVKASYLAEFARVDNPAVLIDHLNLVLCAGQLPNTQKAIMVQTLKAMETEQSTQTSLTEEAKKLNRVAAAVLMVMASPTYLVHK